MTFPVWYMYVFCWRSKFANCVQLTVQKKIWRISKKTLVELEEKFDTELRVEKDFAFHQAIAQGGHNPVISSLLLIITPDILKYYQKI